MFFMKTQIIKSMLRIPAGLIFFLIALVPITVVHRIVVVAKLPRNVDKLITQVYATIEAMTDNTWFPTPSPTLASVKSLNDDLQDAQNLALTRAKGAARNRNSKKLLVINAFYGLRDYVQSICILHPDLAVDIAESAMMFAKKTAVRQKNTFRARCLSAGVIELIGGVRGNFRFHDWGISRDPNDPASWLVNPVPTTTKAKTIITGLRVGETVYLRHRVNTKDGPGDWDQIISILVN